MRSQILPELVAILGEREREKKIKRRKQKCNKAKFTQIVHQRDLKSVIFVLLFHKGVGLEQADTTGQMIKPALADGRFK